MFYKKGVFKNVGKATGKRLCQSLFFKKVTGLTLEVYLKRDCGTDVFLLILRSFKEHLFYGTPQVAASGNKFSKAAPLKIRMIQRKRSTV